MAHGQLEQRLRVGTLVSDKYRIERVLGRGGMGIVLAAVHEKLGGRVALKVIRPEMARQREALERFTREARAMFRLRGPNVCRVLDVGEHAGAPYYVMEYLEGRSLDEVLVSQHTLTPGLAAVYTRQVCAALEEAHSQGIVHRDLKPQNLLVTRAADGSELLKVLDFGISKMQKSSAGEHTLTKEFATLGTPAYMAPEQFEGSSRADARSDIWSLGVVLYLMLTGDLPFPGPGFAGIRAQQLQGPRPPSEISPAIPEGISDVVMRCLDLAPDNRFPNARELAIALEPFTDTELSRATPNTLRDDDVPATRLDPERTILDSPGGTTLTIHNPPAAEERPPTPRAPHDFGTLKSATSGVSLHESALPAGVPTRRHRAIVPLVALGLVGVFAGVLASVKYNAIRSRQTTGAALADSSVVAPPTTDSTMASATVNASAPPTPPTPPTPSAIAAHASTPPGAARRKGGAPEPPAPSATSAPSASASQRPRDLFKENW